MKPFKGNDNRLYGILKRILDLSVSSIGLLILSPLIISIICLVWIKLGWPVFYIQKRPGKHANIFKMIKFRTMIDEYDDKGNLLPDHLRTKNVGKFLRKTSFDELPELINVLKGDMSLVGPRPLLIKYLPYFNERENYRHYVKPGITGLAQVNGRNLLDWNDRLEMDVQYVEKMSFWLDLKILFRTIINTLRQKDVLAVSSEYIPDFDDYRKEQLRNNKDGSSRG